MTTELNFYLSQYQCAADIWTWGAEIRFKPDLATKSLKGTCNIFLIFLAQIFLGKWTSYQHSMLCELPLN